MEKQSYSNILPDAIALFGPFMTDHSFPSAGLIGLPLTVILVKVIVRGVFRAVKTVQF